jgi:hypothetical protein
MNIKSEIESFYQELEKERNKKEACLQNAAVSCSVLLN